MAKIWIKLSFICTMDWVGPPLALQVNRMISRAIFLRKSILVKVDLELLGEH